MVSVMCMFFFFKQKTAYELRISDWSSDVCSSDLQFMSGAETLAQKNGYELVKFFFLATFAAAIPAIISGGIAERSRRSEEHTSELQSLMRISYAVFCLKTKIDNIRHTTLHKICTSTGTITATLPDTVSSNS